MSFLIQDSGYAALGALLINRNPTNLKIHPRIAGAGIGIGASLTQRALSLAGEGTTIQALTHTIALLALCAVAYKTRSYTSNPKLSKLLADAKTAQRLSRSSGTSILTETGITHSELLYNHASCEATPKKTHSDDQKKFEIVIPAQSFAFVYESPTTLDEVLSYLNIKHNQFSGTGEYSFNGETIRFIKCVWPDA